MDNWTVKIIDKGWTDHKDIFIYRRLANGMSEILRGDIVETFISNGAIDLRPSFTLTPDALQAFADALDTSGYKPQKGFLEGKIEAKDDHLQDMRRLVFGKKKDEELIFRTTDE